MDNINEIRLQNKQDVWTLLYYHLCREAFQSFGKDGGDEVVRSAVKNMGLELGTRCRKEQTVQGVETNLLGLFRFGCASAHDPRVCSNLRVETKQVRLWDTYVCPIADFLMKRDALNYGICFCEEYMRALVSGYTEGRGQVNVSKAMTYKRDVHCQFAAYLRPANLNFEQKSRCFKSDANDTFSKKVDFSQFISKITIYLLEMFYKSFIEYFGEEGRCAFARGLRKAATELIVIMEKHANDVLLPCDEKFFEFNFPISLNIHKDSLWDEIDARQSSESVQKNMLNHIKKWFKICQEDQFCVKDIHVYTLDEKCLMNLSDTYTLMYGYIVQALISEYGEDGERTAREATRRYGRDRGKATRQRHLDVNAKITMEHLFSLYYDLPNDPRFRREKQVLNAQERISHTLICPMANIWKSHGQMAIGRLYCEEFHPACYSEYAYGYTKVNLARTLTQAGDDYCSFSVILRPFDLPEHLRKTCFEEYDPDYVKPYFPPKPVSAKDGFEQISIKLFYHLLSTAIEQLGEGAVGIIKKGVGKCAEAVAPILLETAKEYELPIDDELIFDNIPISFDTEKRSKFWVGYQGYNAQEIWKTSFRDALLNALHYNN